MTQLGLALQRDALTKSRQGREEMIERVRRYLVNNRKCLRTDWAECDGYVSRVEVLSGDDVMRAVEALGMTGGDHRWVGNCLKGWDAVTPTNQFVPSRRKERHGAPVRVWRFR